MKKLFLLQIGLNIPTVAIVHNGIYIESVYCKLGVDIEMQSKYLHNLMSVKYEDRIIAYTNKEQFKRINTKYFVSNKSVRELFLDYNIDICLEDIVAEDNQ